MDLWRISKFASIDGEGGRLYAGRWNSGGTPVAYLSESPPGALIEILVHLELKTATLPTNFQLLRIAAPDRLKIPHLDVPKGAVWKNDEALTRRLGDTWIKQQTSALARVPSAILPETFNYLFNPLHPDAARIAVAQSQLADIDIRLLRS
jgi:RES domain-containing protein